MSASFVRAGWSCRYKSSADGSGRRVTRLGASNAAGERAIEAGAWSIERPPINFSNPGCIGVLLHRFTGGASANKTCGLQGFRGCFAERFLVDGCEPAELEEPVLGRNHRDGGGGIARGA